MAGPSALHAEVESPFAAWRLLAGLIVLLLGFAAAWYFTPLADLVTAERIVTWSREFGGRPWAPLLVIALYTPACCVMFPRPLITMFAVLAFGAWLGFLYAVCGVLLAALVAYAGGRSLDFYKVQCLAGTKLNRLSAVLRVRGLLAVTAVRLVPIAPFVVVGLVAGAIRIRFVQYILGTAFGMLPGTFAATVFGDQLQVALRDPRELNYVLVAVCATLLIGGALIVRRWLLRNMQQQSAGN